jgi:myo-inositol 2-dehydrogenase/D-chiro-inositol 1-dehydrogenase
MTIRVGFIGAGGVSGEYRQRLAQLGDRVAITAVCDLQIERAERVAADAGASVYTDWREMLAREPLDAIFDNLPPFARGDELIVAAGLGRHIFTTKPLGLTLAGPLRTLAAIEASGVINSVGHMFRYASTVAEIRRLLAGRPVQLIEGRALGANPINWQASQATGGGLLVEHSTHLIDLVRYLAGDAVQVAGFGVRSTGAKVDYEDSTTVMFQLDGGAVATVASSCALDNYFWAMTVVATDLRLELLFDDGTVTGVADGRPVRFEGGSAGYQEQIDAFIQAIESDDQALILSSYRDGVTTLATTLAAREAVVTGRPVAVSAFPG